jgi:hypothetical protein
MDIVAYVGGGAQIGTAQVLTFAIPIGVLGVVTFWGVFQRPGRHKFGPPRRVPGAARPVPEDTSASEHSR